MIILWLLLFVYVVFILALIIGFAKVPKNTIVHLPPKTTFSIVVPFRNEEENLQKLLHTISHLDYPKDLFEVILVDDNEGEYNGSFSVFNFELSVVKNERKSNSPKKDAIETAVKIAKNDWILTTDADCLVQGKWLSTLDSFIQKTEKKMIASGVWYLPENSFLHHFQNLDFLALQGVTIGSFGLGLPFMCNGANFAYRKDFFHELDGFKGNAETASGDDVFLLQKAVRYDKKAVGFCVDIHSITATKSVKSWGELFFQRVRWAGKSVGYYSFFGKVLALAVLGGNVGFIAAFVLWFCQILNADLFLLYVFVKFFADWILFFQSGWYFQTPVRYVFASSLCYPFFSTAAGLYSLFGKYKWKGRDFRR